MIDGTPRCSKCGHTLLPTTGALPKLSSTGALPPLAIPTPQKQDTGRLSGEYAKVSDSELEALFAEVPTPIGGELDVMFAETNDAPTVPPPAKTKAQLLPGFRTPSGRDLSRYRATTMIRDKEGATPWIVAIYTSAMDALDDQNYSETLRHLKRCLDDNPDFIDAMVWLGRLEDEPAVRMKHIKTALALNPSNGEAMRELMILNGELDPDQEFNEFTEAEVRQTDATAASKIRSIKCPRCGSPNMSDDDASSTVLVCDSCGYAIDKPKHTSNLQSLTAALIKRRSQDVIWIVGSRTLKCNGCGAERTLGRSQMSSECAFCGSRQVIEQDALGTLSQPESIVPFRVPKQMALEQVKKATTGGVEKLKSFFVDNRISRTEIHGIFLPFWLFDAMVDITHTYERVENTNHNRGLGALRLAAGDVGGVSNFTGMSNRLVTEKLNDAALNVPVPAFKQPPVPLVMRASRYDYSRAVDYAPEFIAQHAAEIYTIDFDKASMDVRGTVGEMMRRKYHRDDGTYKTTGLSTMMTQASFRLLLLPMWIVTIFEKDNDVRPILVNGQTGQVSLGKAVKPQ